MAPRVQAALDAALQDEEDITLDAKYCRVFFTPFARCRTEFENGTKFVRLGIAFTRYWHEKI